MKKTWALKTIRYLRLRGILQTKRIAINYALLIQIFIWLPYLDEHAENNASPCLKKAINIDLYVINTIMIHGN